MVRTIIVLARNLGMDVIAEGVETLEEAADLIGLDYGFAQGFLYSHPVGVAEINALLDVAGPLAPDAVSL